MKKIIFYLSTKIFRQDEEQAKLHMMQYDELHILRRIALWIGIPAFILCILLVVMDLTLLGLLLCGDILLGGVFCIMLDVISGLSLVAVIVAIMLELVGRRLQQD